MILENYWDRSLPIFPTGAIELQAHGTDLGFRDIYVREISSETYGLTVEEQSEGFVALFNGKNLDGWIGNKTDYKVDNSEILVDPQGGGSGNLYTEKEYADFAFRFEFQLTPGAITVLGFVLRWREMLPMSAWKSRCWTIHHLFTLTCNSISTMARYMESFPHAGALSSR